MVESTSRIALQTVWVYMRLARTHSPHKEVGGASAQCALLREQSRVGRLAFSVTPLMSISLSNNHPVLETENVACLEPEAEENGFRIGNGLPGKSGISFVSGRFGR